jgi:general secretion pathway protein A
MYLGFYQLKQEPFRLTPDPHFLHLAEPHRAALTTLIHGVALRKGLLVLTGPVGTGKTTLLHATLQILSGQNKGKAPLNSAFLVNPLLTREEFFEALLDEFEIQCASTSKPRRLAALSQMFFECQRQGGTCLLIIDEAHLLSAELLEEVRLLGNTETYREKLLQIVLSGQPELLDLLGKPERRAMKQRIAGICELRPLSLAETQNYIAERLHAAGLRGSWPFTRPALERIFFLTEGVPRLINLLCDTSLSMGFQTQSRLIEPAMLDAAAAAIGLTDRLAIPENGAGPIPGAKSGLSASSFEVLVDYLRRGGISARSDT